MERPFEFNDNSKFGPDESYYIVEHGGSPELRLKYHIYLHAVNSITGPGDFPEDQIEAMEALNERTDLTDEQVVVEIGKILQ